LWWPRTTLGRSRSRVDQSSIPRSTRTSAGKESAGFGSDRTTGRRAITHHPGCRNAESRPRTATRVVGPSTIEANSNALVYMHFASVQTGGSVTLGGWAVTDCSSSLSGHEGWLTPSRDVPASQAGHHRSKTAVFETRVTGRTDPLPCLRSSPLSDKRRAVRLSLVVTGAVTLRRR
jgi:hypothetical protein